MAEQGSTEEQTRTEQPSTDEQPEREQPGTQKATWTEEFEVETGKLVDSVKALIQEGNVRRIIIRKQNDEVLLDLPLYFSAAAGALALYLAPWFTLLGVVAGAAVRLKVQVVRKEEDAE